MCMGNHSSPPLKLVGLWLTSWVPQWGTYPMAPGCNNTHVLLAQPHPCGPMREQCCTRLCLARGLHHRLHNGLGKMLTAGAVCPCGQHLRRPCGPQLAASCDTFVLYQKSHHSLELPASRHRNLVKANFNMVTARGFIEHRFGSLIYLRRTTYV